MSLRECATVGYWYHFARRKDTSALLPAEETGVIPVDANPRRVDAWSPIRCSHGLIGPPLQLLEGAYYSKLRSNVRLSRVLRA